MKVTLLQTDIQWAQPELNITRADRLIATAEESDLYVLPEMWSTGFATNPQGIAHEEADNEALQWMLQTARLRRCAICGSLAVHLSDGTYRNRHYFADGRSEQLNYYDKHHLFTYSHENLQYTPGQHHAVVNYNGFRLLLLTCYDLRFPGWCRYATGREYDAIVIVANWPAARQLQWQLLIRARAIENQCYVVAVNRVGEDNFGHYAGASAAIDALGHTIRQCRLHQEQALTVTLDFEELLRRRNKFRVLDERDT
ncbi:MAG: nitrilase family protein [Prevotella sp.]|nr:nitrilase family protein [Prevotella sp.]